MNYDKDNDVLERQLLDRLNDCIRSAHYWITEQPAINQARDALMEASGLVHRLAEKQSGCTISLFGWDKTKK